MLNFVAIHKGINTTPGTTSDTFGYNTFGKNIFNNVQLPILLWGILNVNKNYRILMLGLFQENVLILTCLFFSFFKVKFFQEKKKNHYSNQFEILEISI